MPATLERIKFQDNASFSIGIFQDNLEKCIWHYHDTYEISFITEGSGKRIVADSMHEFQPGDMVFLGRGLPHVWISDNRYRTPYGRAFEMVSIQFDESVIPSQLLDMSEFRNISGAIELARRGIQVDGETLNEISSIMLQLPYLKDIERLLEFYKMIDIIGKSKNSIQLASEEYLRKKFHPGNKRIESIHEYLMKHYQQEIDLQKLASLVNMAEGSLCRFFKASTGMTVFEYLNQIKVEFACKLLMDAELSVLQVSLDTGFNNLSHFNKQFRKHTGTTPTGYRRRYGDVYA